MTGRRIPESAFAKNGIAVPPAVAEIRGGKRRFIVRHIIHRKYSQT